MPTYVYEARDTSTGKIIKAELQANSEAGAAKLLNSQGLAPIDIKLKTESVNPFDRFKNRITTKDKVMFARQLSTLINAGLPLAQSLRTVLEQMSNPSMQAVIAQILTDIEGGMSFAKALEKHPKVFNKVFTSLIAAGETSGTLDLALERIATQQEKDAEIASKVRGALVYPAIVLAVIVGVVIFMLTTVLPQVELLYEDLNQELPFVTSILLVISRFLIDFWWVGLLAFIGLIYALRNYVQTKSGRSVWDQLKMNIPLFGKLFRKLYMARFCRTGSTLMSTGVPMLEMLRITSEAVNNVHVGNAILRAAEKVKGGKALSDALKGEPNFLPLVPQMLHIGEQSGAIDDIMAKAASYYEQELDNEIKAISTTIEPAMMVVLALVAGLMVAAILLPVYGLVGQNLAI